MTFGWWLDVGAFAAALTAVLTCLGLIARSRVGRWLAEKITEDLRARRKAEMCDLLAPITAELTPNGGESLRDAVDRIERRLTHHIADNIRHR